MAGRPRLFDPSAVLERALELFWQNGYRATTTRVLEDGLGLSQSSLYNAFGSKRQLFEAALDRYEDMTKQALVEPLEESSDGLAAIDRFFGALGEWVTHEGRGGCLIINLMAEDGGEDDAITTRTRAYRARVRGALGGALQRAALSGEIGTDSLDRRTDVLFGQVLAVNISARGGSSTGEVRALLAGVSHLLESWRSH
jgi:TetR/AcrR family transcriptional repressor of nem operon